MLQAISGLGIAVFCVYGRVRNWPLDRLYGGMFVLVCTWMALLGPASEIHAYLLVAPAAVFCLVESFSRRSDPVTRGFAAIAYVCLLLAILRVAFIPKMNSPYLLVLQPLGALALLGYALRRYVRGPSIA